MKVAYLFAAMMLVAAVNADVYMQNPRGSNNRLNENNQNRNNANRLFDSQNNNQGGYNVGDENNAQDGQGVMDYYVSSILSFEWTNQHGANNPNVVTDVVLQYACDEQVGQYDLSADGGLRDGTDTDTINNNADTTRGRHETEQFYDDCDARERNRGLFLADQENNLDGDTAIYTRQNTNGNKHGFECPEEREYYPYWHPTVFKDLAVLTSEPKRCNAYKKESINVQAYGYCAGNNAANNQGDCGATWTTYSHNIAAPDCVELGWSRDNHLGNTIGGKNLMYNFSIPAEMQGKTCALRMRYNISTSDVPRDINATYNGDMSPIQDNPTVNFGTKKQAISVKLALNTDQYFRTFQDRSHTFTVSARPGNVPNNANIYNLNVRGRRGNIVQTYPATEYDFAPTRLEMKQADYVHIQWTGSLNTPDGAGQGAGNTDRSNIIQTASANHNYPIGLNDNANTMITNAQLREDLATVGQGAGVDDELDGAPAYYNANGGAPFQIPKGVHSYMCTRNNNFTNRSHKGLIVVN